MDVVAVTKCWYQWIHFCSVLVQRSSSTLSYLAEFMIGGLRALFYDALRRVPCSPNSVLIKKTDNPSAVDFY